MKNYIKLGVWVLVFAGLAAASISTALAQARLINVGDSTLVTLDAAVNGDPILYPAWAVPITVTSGIYEFYLEPSYWTYTMGIPIVGGAAIADSHALKYLMAEPIARGTTNVDETVRTIDFGIPLDQTVLAGVLDPQINDNTGTCVFQLTKVANLPQLSASCSATNIVITWPTNSAGFVLAQSSSLLGTNINWTTVTNIAVFTNSLFRISLPLTSSNDFFSLQNP